jgi:hypothetical protein
MMKPRALVLFTILAITATMVWMVAKHQHKTQSEAIEIVLVLSYPISIACGIGALTGIASNIGWFRGPNGLISLKRTGIAVAAILGIAILIDGRSGVTNSIRWYVSFEFIASYVVLVLLKGGART